MNSLCSIKLLESALAGSLSRDEEMALQQHLEECESCSTTIEDLAGGPSLCQQAAALLGGDEFEGSATGREEWSVVDFTVEHLEPTDEPDMLGRLGGYDVLEIIGRGGMGVVLKGFDRELKRCVAIKVLAPHLAHSPLARKRFAREAQAAAAVVHPHVLAIHQVQPGGRLPFLVMPLVAGESLAQRLAARGTLELKEILRIGMQAAAGLAAAHEQGLVHRDVKPANILLETGVERAVLTDFGLARAADDVAMTRWGVIAGTPQYMSPEQAQGQALDGRSDLFSLGCVIYEMATGTSPFHADSTIATMRRLVDDQPASMTTLNSELPQWFVNIVVRLLEKNPAQRFRSASEVSDLLEQCLAHVQQPTTVSVPAEICFVPNQSPARSSWRIALRKPGLGRLSAMLIAVVLFVSCAWYLAGLFRSAETVKQELSQSNLHRLTAALTAYEEEHGHYPPSIIFGKDGKGGPPHSWRVEILPYLGQKAVYEQYHFDEPWDSEHNRLLLPKMPAVLRSPFDVPDSINTAYFGVILEDQKKVFSVQAGNGPAGSGGSAGSVSGVSEGALGRPMGAGGGGAPPTGPVGVPTAGGGATGPSGSIVGADEFTSRRRAAIQWNPFFSIDKREWLRRVKLDLTGTIPTDDEYAALLADNVPQLAERTIDRLLKESKQLTWGMNGSGGCFLPDGSTFFSQPQGIMNSDITDGTSNTITIVEAKRSLPWTKPEDLSFNSTQPVSPFGGWYKQGWFAGFADGKVKYLSNDNSPKLLRSLLTYNDGENVFPILVAPSNVTPQKEVVFDDFAKTLSRSASNSEARPIDSAANEHQPERTAFEGRWYVESVEETGKPTRAGEAYEPWIFYGDQLLVHGSDMAGTWNIRIGMGGQPQNIDVERISDKSGYGLTGVFELKEDSLRIALTHVGPRPVALNSVGPNEQYRKIYELKRPGRILAYRRSTNPKIIEAHVGDVVMVTEAASKVHVGGLAVNRTNETVGYGVEEIDGKMHLIFTARKQAAAEFSWSFNTKGGGRIEYSGLMIKFDAGGSGIHAAGSTSTFGTLGGFGPVTIPSPVQPEGSRFGNEPSGMRTTDQEITPIAARSVPGSQFQILAKGRKLGVVFGTDVYTVDSPIDTAALHAGLLREGERGILTVTILKPQQEYLPSDRNDVASVHRKESIEGYTLQKERNSEANGVGASTTTSITTENSSVRALELLTQDDPEAAKSIERELKAELDELDVLTRQHGANSEIVLKRTETFCQRILEGIRKRIDRRRQRTAEEMAILQRIDRLLVRDSQGSATSSGSTFSGSVSGLSAPYQGLLGDQVRLNEVATLNASQWRNRFGEQFDVQVTGSTSGVVWGTDVYTDDSSIASAAVHAGLVQVGETATVTVTMVLPKQVHMGSTRNGVTSALYLSPWQCSYMLQRRPDRLPPAVDGGVGVTDTVIRQSEAPNALAWLGRFGEQFDVEITGNDQAASYGAVWGTDVYTCDSSIALAAVHTGLAKVGEKAIVTVTIVKSPAFHHASERNGVASNKWGSYPASFVLHRKAVHVTDAPNAVRLIWNRLNSVEGITTLGIGPQGTLIGPPLELDHAVVQPDWWKSNPNNLKTAEEFKDRVGVQFDLNVIGHINGKVIGTDLYRFDSVIASAAVHAGLVGQGEAAVISVSIVRPNQTPNQMVSGGCSRNGVESTPFEDAAPGFTLTRKPTNARNFQGQLGFQFDVDVIGQTIGAVWGTDVYTCDSDIATASVHSGLVKSGESAKVTVTIVRSPDKYTGSARNDVTSLDYGPYPAGYTLALKNASSANLANTLHDDIAARYVVKGPGLTLNKKWMQLLADRPGDKCDRSARQRMLGLSRELAAEPQGTSQWDHLSSSVLKDDIIQLQRLAFQAQTLCAVQNTTASEPTKNIVDSYLQLVDPKAWPGQTLYVEATGQLHGYVWGVGPYTTDSDLGTAAVHAGRLKVGETGLLKVKVNSGSEQYAGSHANGVSTRSYGSYAVSFSMESLPDEVPEPGVPETRSLRQVLIDATLSRIERAAGENPSLTEVLKERLRDLQANSDVVLFWPGATGHQRRGESSLESFRDRVGQSFHFLVRGSNSGKSDQKTSQFSLDQNLSDAAVHAGLVATGEFGIVRVKIGPLAVQAAENKEPSQLKETIGFTIEKPADVVIKAFLNLEGLEPQLDPEIDAHLTRFKQVISDGGFSGERFDSLQSTPVGLGQMRFVLATIRQPSDPRWDARSVLLAAKQALELPLTGPQRLSLYIVAGTTVALANSPLAVEQRAESAQWYLAGLQAARKFDLPEQPTELSLSRQKEPQESGAGVPKERTTESHALTLQESLIKLRTDLRMKLLQLYQDPRHPRPTREELQRLLEKSKAKLDPLDSFLREIEQLCTVQEPLTDIRGISPVLLLVFVEDVAVRCSITVRSNYQRDAAKRWLIDSLSASSLASPRVSNRHRL